jgi:hypothetical protein
MRELSLHILDIAQNSIVAEADEIRIAIVEDFEQDRLTICIKDDGKGMDRETLDKVVDPFYTTRTTRKVGLGIPMFKAAAELCDGKFTISSKPGVGTDIMAEFKHSHIDRMPLGNMSDTLITIINSNEKVDLVYTHKIGKEKFTLSTKDIKKTLGELPITNLDVLIWLRDYIKENLKVMYDNYKNS